MEKSKKSNKDLLTRIRKRYPQMVEPDRENRAAAMDDMKFALVPGNQWEPKQKKDRGNRPCYEVNKLRTTGKRVINQMRENRPQGKVRAVEDGDKATAEALEGLVRNIWQVSDGDTVIDYAAEHQVFGGMGAWRVVVDYADDDAFDQDVRIEALRNPFCLYADPACSDPSKRDAMDWILTERISKTEYEMRWPKAEVTDFEESEFDDEEEWESDERVRICEYWYKEPVERTILQLSDGRVVRSDDLTPEDEQAMAAGMLQVVKQRQTRSHDIYMCIASGKAILEGPTKFAGRKFPFVIVYGEWTVIDGKPFWCGITRHAKDSQRAYNIATTAINETIAAAPQAKYLVTPKQITGLESTWAVAHKQNQPFLVYNPDPAAPAPQRMGGAEVPVALMQQAAMASEEIKAVTGIFDASLGNRSNEQSGVAIRSRQAQGEIATYNYADNMGKAIAQTWDIIVDCVQAIYDTPRMVRVLGVDGAEKYLGINGGDPNSDKARDVTRGKYDVAVTAGPGFSTQREQAAETYTQMVQAFPDMMPIVGDLMFKAMDLPYSDKMSERMKAMLPPQIQQMESQGKEIPPEAMAVMNQAQQALQMAEQQSQLVQQAAAEAEQKIAEADKAQAQVAQAVAEFEVKKAQFETQVAETQTKFAQQAMDLQTQQGETEAGNERESLNNELGKALAEIQQAVAEYMTQATQTLAEIQARSAPQIVVPNKPRIVAVKKQNGMHIPIYEDQVTQ